MLYDRNIKQLNWKYAFEDVIFFINIKPLSMMWQWHRVENNEQNETSFYGWPVVLSAYHWLYENKSFLDKYIDIEDLFTTYTTVLSHILMYRRCTFPSLSLTHTKWLRSRALKLGFYPLLFSSETVFFSHKFLQHSSKPSKFLQANRPKIHSGWARSERIYALRINCNFF